MRCSFQRTIAVDRLPGLWKDSSLFASLTMDGVFGLCPSFGGDTRSRLERGAQFVCPPQHGDRSAVPAVGEDPPLPPRLLAGKRKKRGGRGSPPPDQNYLKILVTRY